MKNIIIFCLFFFALNTAAYCGQLSKIELTDGSVINGEIISYENSVYTIGTSTFGEVKVEAAKVSKIGSVDPALANLPSDSAAQVSIPTKAQIDSQGQALMSNPENMAIITRLAAEPEIQELAKDPEIADIVKRGDIKALVENEKFKAIVQSQKLQEAIRKLKQ